MGLFWASFIRLFCVFSKLSTCLQYAGDSRQHESKEVIYVTLQDGLNFLTGMRLVDSSALELPVDHLGPIACDFWGYNSLRRALVPGTFCDSRN